MNLSSLASLPFVDSLTADFASGHLTGVNSSTLVSLPFVTLLKSHIASGHLKRVNSSALTSRPFADSLKSHFGHDTLLSLIFLSISRFFSSFLSLFVHGNPHTPLGFDCLFPLSCPLLWCHSFSLIL